MPSRHIAIQGSRTVNAASEEPYGSDGARKTQEYPGGVPAPVTGTYETANLFGRLTGHRVTIQQGELLPALPRGFTWVIVTG